MNGLPGLHGDGFSASVCHVNSMSLRRKGVKPKDRHVHGQKRSLIGYRGLAEQAFTPKVREVVLEKK
jgi:hypothetical protein